MEHELGIRCIFQTILVSQSSTDYDNVWATKTVMLNNNVIALASTKEYGMENIISIFT